MEEGAVLDPSSDMLDCIDLDGLLQEFNDDPCFNLDLLSDLPHPSDSTSPVKASMIIDSPSAESGSPDSASFLVCFVEKFLMDDVESDAGGCVQEVGEDCVADFFSDVFVDTSAFGKGETGSPESCEASAEYSEGKEKEASAEAGVEEEDDNDPVAKKRRRQMRNRESALKSRERKKEYIKDLEMKSRYLESQCRRLDYALQCCMAENMALRQSLQFRKDRRCGASAAKQESAVLFVESLLLGSLFWLVSIIVCLFLVPNLKSLNQEISSERGLAALATDTLEPKIEKLGEDLRLELIRMRRRCRGMRSRVKVLFTSSAWIELQLRYPSLHRRTVVMSIGRLGIIYTYLTEPEQAQLVLTFVSGAIHYSY
ncbi:bZIP transcription factor 60 [Apostasia shenzhenica]|uniref:BZIP transcription factor 60 n=1 Tax=Apostasia shenzhenica TaxID=1088818 RepID=A0A2I0B3Q7_9ASPA|nr:bZIP transcription factor 60 [Apostasia shenzhenica]